MNLNPHKAKQFLVLVVKLLIIAGAFYFIYTQLASNEKLEWNKFAKIYDQNKSFNLVGGIIILTFLNRFLEILKWRNLASVLHPITIWQATAQVLAALTAGIFTPNGIGEYAGKALYYSKKETGKVIFLNLICNGIQMIITIVFGLFALLLFNCEFGAISNNFLLFVFITIVTICSILFYFRKFTIKGYSVLTLTTKINAIPKKIHSQNILLGLGRYLTILHQYYLLLLLFDIRVSYSLLITTIAVVQFLASSLPTFQFLDFAVKGGVALFFFNFFGINEWIVIFITTLIWILNVVIPVLMGSFFVFTFKSKFK